MPPKKFKLLSVFAVLLFLSATCSGFLVGRTVRLHEEGKFEQLQEVSKPIIDAGAILHRGVEAVKRVVLR